MEKPTQEKVECVGSLLVHTNDLEELSAATPTTKEKVECVGSLLVHTSDLEELSEATKKEVPKKALDTKLVDRVAEDLHTTADDFNPWSNHS